MKGSQCSARWLWLYEEILAFLFTTSGWILVISTLPTDYWKVASLEGIFITTNLYWSNLWKICVTDLTGLSNCKDFPSMLALDAYIQACRGLMISAICLGFFGSAFALVGMKCTKIGGSDRNKSNLACVAGVSFILSGLCSFSGCSLYAHQIITEFFDPNFVELKYELGAGLFIGWGGAFLCVVGGCMFCCSTASHGGKKRHSQTSYTYKSASLHSHIASTSKGKLNSLSLKSLDV